MNKGDILVSTWGYEQTNADFFEVVEVSPKTVTVRPIASREDYEAESMTGSAWPIPGAFRGEPMRRRPVPELWAGGGESIRITNYAYARPLARQGDGFAPTRFSSYG